MKVSQGFQVIFQQEGEIQRNPVMANCGAGHGMNLAIHILIFLGRLSIEDEVFLGRNQVRLWRDAAHAGYPQWCRV